MRAEITPSQYPKAPPWRRGAALGLDFLGAAIVSVIFGLNLLALTVSFLLCWFGLRVVLVLRNQGQSLGRWALDMKVIDAQYGTLPLFQALIKREGVVGFECLLFLIGLVNLNPSSAWALLLFLPLGADCIVAFADPLKRQTFHDRIARTFVLQSRRGYSLDLKIKRLVADARQRMKK